MRTKQQTKALRAYVFFVVVLGLLGVAGLAVGYLPIAAFNAVVIVAWTVRARRHYRELEDRP